MLAHNSQGFLQRLGIDYILDVQWVLIKRVHYEHRFALLVLAKYRAELLTNSLFKVLVHLILGIWLSYFFFIKMFLSFILDLIILLSVNVFLYFKEKLIGNNIWVACKVIELQAQSRDLELTRAELWLSRVRAARKLLNSISTPLYNICIVEYKSVHVSLC